MALYRRIGELAAAEGRSINGMIVYILNRYIRGEKEPLEPRGPK